MDQLRPILRVRATPLFAFLAVYVLLSLIAQAPSLAFFPYDVVRMAGMYGFTHWLAGALLMLVLVRYEQAAAPPVPGERWVLLSATMAVVVVALVAAAFAGFAGANTMLALARCATRSEQALGVYLYNTTNLTASTDYALLARTPYVHNVLGAIQACLEDFPATVTHAAFAFVVAAINVALALYMYLARE